MLVKCVLLTGSNGQVSRDFNRFACRAGINVLEAGRSELDICESDAILEFINRNKVNIVVNGAAYTHVDQAESELGKAYATNYEGVVNLAQVCNDNRIPLVHFSTDYVFSGNKVTPYKETDPVAPQSVYGASKLAGEQALLDIHDKAIILRISWVFGRYGKNFVKTIQRLASERDELNIVADQHGCPTSTADLSRQILYLFKQLDRDKGPWGIWHYCNSPATTWFEFAQAIVEETRKYRELKVKKINPIQTENFPTPAKRPANSVMDCSKINRDFGIQPADWRDELKQLIQELETN